MRDAQAQQQINEAHAPATGIEMWTCSACGELQHPQGPLGDGLGRCSACVVTSRDLGPLPTMEQMADQTPRTILTGEHHDAYVEFTAASRALVDHQATGAALTERYRQALGRLSQLVAAK